MAPTALGTRNTFNDQNIQLNEKNTIKSRRKPRSTSNNFAVPEAVRPDSNFDNLVSTYGKGQVSEMLSCDVEEIGRCGFAAEYVVEVFKYLAEKEQAPLRDAYAVNQVFPDYMERQQDISSAMRKILVDWLHAVHLRFNLSSQTYFLGINILDRFLSLMKVKRSKLQLVGCCCLWMASKFEEVYAPEMQDFVIMSDNAITTESLITTEKLIFETLGRDLIVPTAYEWSKRFLKVMGASVVVQIATSMILEQSLINVEILQYRSSTLAIAGISCAILLVQRNKENICASYREQGKEYTQHEDLSIWSQSDLKSIVQNLWDHAKIQSCLEDLKLIMITGMESAQHTSIKNKYAHSMYMRISTLDMECLRDHEEMSDDEQ
eukprot:maker-scaffold_13-snap-gene-3.60-mRNA-1 protein AED:0.00 eAED:0.00 QI:154/1/1/1/1/1/2/122/376